MDKQKQIEEMTELMADWALRNNMCWHEGHAKALAETFAENDYEKIPENAVVLTREEYDGKSIIVEMSGGHKLKLSVGTLGEMSKTIEEHTRKETAEKFEKKLKYEVDFIPNHLFCVYEVKDAITKVAKEIKEGKL